MMLNRKRIKKWAKVTAVVVAFAFAGLPLIMLVGYLVQL